MGFLRNIVDLIVTVYVLSALQNNLDKLISIPVIGKAFEWLGKEYKSRQCFAILIVYLIIHSIPLPLI